MKIIKFGGSCLKEGSDFSKIYTILNNNIEEKQVVVLSALFGVTDILIKSLNLKKMSEKSIDGAIGKVRKKHSLIIKQVYDRKDIVDEIERELEPYFEKLRKLYLAILYTGEISESLESSIHSFGERLSVILFSSIMNKMGLNTLPFFSDSIGVVKKKGCTNCADLRKTKRNLGKFGFKIPEKTIPVITGYFALDHNKRVSTFGRNGSDYSASVVAYGLDADTLEFWKDVPGFMSSDPNIVKDSLLIDELTIDEAAELSYFGASILHPRCLEPIRGGKTEIIIRNFQSPDKEGSVIRQDSTNKENYIRGVSFNEHISVLKINGAGVGYKPGIIGHIGTALSDNDINIYSIITSQTSISLIIDQKDLSKSLKILKSIKDTVIENVKSVKDLTLIAVVGENIARKKNSLQRLFVILNQLNINIEMISAGASNSAYYFLIKKEGFKESINKIHNELIMK